MNFLLARSISVTSALLTAGCALSVLLEPASAQSGDRAVANHSLGKELARARIELLGWEPTPERFLVAMGTGHRPLIDLYLDSGAAVNVHDDKGRSPLLLALLAKDWTLAERLLEANADFTASDALGTTPVMAAAMGGNTALVRSLITRGAKLESADTRGHTALHYAVVGRQRPAAELLMSVGPVPSTPCCEGCNLLGHALETEDWTVIDPILDRLEGPLEWNDWSGAAMVKALANSDRSRIRRLLAKHPGPPVPAEGAQPLLAYAVAQNDLSQLRALLECGADPNTPLNQNVDPALNALVSSSFVRFYVDKEPGFTVLMLAAAMKREECLRLLLEKGATKGLATNGKSRLIALYFAAWADSASCAQILLGKVPHREELRIEISLDEQKAEVIKNGAPVFTAPISSGRKGFATPMGDFVVTDKHRDHRSSIYQEAKMPYFMRLSCRDFGMHEGVLPGRPASHGCVRLPAAAARKLFKEIPIGTWVSIRR